MSDILHTVVPGLAVKRKPTVEPEDLAAKARAEAAEMNGELPEGGNPVLRSLRRVQLWEVARAHGVPHSESEDDWATLVTLIERHCEARGIQVFPLPKPQVPEDYDPMPEATLVLQNGAPPATAPQTDQPEEETLGQQGFARADVKAMPFMAKKALANQRLKAAGQPELDKSAGKDQVEAALRRYA